MFFSIFLQPQQSLIEDILSTSLQYKCTNTDVSHWDKTILSLSFLRGFIRHFGK